MINSPKRKEFKSRIPTFVGRNKRKSAISPHPIDSSQKLKSSIGTENIYSEYVDVLDAYMNQDILSERRQLRKFRSQIELAKVQLESINEEKCEYQRKKRKLQLSMKEGTDIYNKLDEILKSRNAALEAEFRENSEKFENKKEEVTKKFSEKLDEFKKQCENLVEVSTIDEETENNRDRKLESLNKECANLTRKLKQTKEVLTLKLANIQKESDLKLIRQDKNDVTFSKLRKECEIIESSTTDIRLEIESKKSELEASETKCKRLECDISAMKPFTGSIETELGKLRCKERELDSDIQATSTENGKLMKGLYKDMEAKFKSASKKIQSSEKVIFKFRKEIEKYQNHIALYVIASDTSFCVENSTLIPEKSDLSTFITLHLDDLKVGLSHAIILFDIENPEGIWSNLEKWLGTLGTEKVVDVSDSQFEELLPLLKCAYKKGLNMTFDANGKAVDATIMFFCIHLESHVVKALDKIYSQFSVLTVANVASHEQKPFLERLCKFRKADNNAAYKYRNSD